MIPGVEDRPDPNVASQVLVGMMIFFMFFGGATAARSILDEHRHGTLFRLFTTPTRRSVVLGGKYVGVFVVVLVQSVVLLLVGRLLVRSRVGRDGPGDRPHSGRAPWSPLRWASSPCPSPRRPRRRGP